MPEGRWTRPRPGSTYALSLPAGDVSGATPRITAVIGMFLALAGYAVVTPLVDLAVLAIARPVESPGESYSAYTARSNAFDTIGGVVGAHLGLGSLIAVVAAVLAYVHRRRLAWIWSVRPGMRWRYALVCLIVALVGLALVLLVRGVPGWNPEPRAVAYLVAVLLTSPLQAAAEEVLFRGYIQQSLGAITGSDVLAIGGSALLFALFHGVQNPALFVDRFVFGVVAGVLVRVTGGLEAGIAAHVANNLLAFGLATLSGSVAALRAVTAISWTDVAFDLVGFSVVAAGCWATGRGMRVQTRVRGLPV